MLEVKLLPKPGNQAFVFGSSSQAWKPSFRDQSSSQAWKLSFRVRIFFPSLEAEFSGSDFPNFIEMLSVRKHWTSFMCQKTLPKGGDSESGQVRVLWKEKYENHELFYSTYYWAHRDPVASLPLDFCHTCRWFVSNNSVANLPTIINTIILLTCLARMNGER